MLACCTCWGLAGSQGRMLLARLATAASFAGAHGSERCGFPSLPPAVHVVDVSSKQAPPRLLAALEAHAAPVLGVAWSEDESRLASCDKRGVVAVWDAGQKGVGPAVAARSGSGEAAAAEDGAAAAVGEAAPA